MATPIALWPETVVVFGPPVRVAAGWSRAVAMRSAALSGTSPTWARTRGPVGTGAVRSALFWAVTRPSLESVHPGGTLRCTTLDPGAPLAPAGLLPDEPPPTASTTMTTMAATARPTPTRISGRGLRAGGAGCPTGAAAGGPVGGPAAGLAGGPVGGPVGVALGGPVGRVASLTGPARSIRWCRAG